MIFQQGDVIVEAQQVMPKDPTTQNYEALETNVVQEGEHTGHAHRLHGNGFRLYKKNAARHLRVIIPTALRHEEHKEIILPPGDYIVRIVKEFDHFEEEAREVRD